MMGFKLSPIHTALAEDFQAGTSKMNLRVVCRPSISNKFFNNGNTAASSSSRRPEHIMPSHNLSMATSLHSRHRMVGASLILHSFTNIQSDSVFFLHHTQLHRIRWVWWQADLDRQYNEFIGPKEDFRERKFFTRGYSVCRCPWGECSGQGYNTHRYCATLLQILIH